MRKNAGLLNLTEMRASFNSYRRIEAETGKTIDNRDKMARDFASMCIKTPSSIDLVPPSDCAAAFSHCVGVMYPDSVIKLRELKAAPLKACLDNLSAADRLPLAAKFDFATDFLRMLVSTPEGQVLYRAVAQLLLRAQSDAELHKHLYFPPGCVHGHTPKSVSRENEEESPNQEAEGLAEEY